MNTLFRASIAILLSSSFLLPTMAEAKSEYLYRNRANWVKIAKAKGDIPLGALNHPYPSVTPSQMEAMLLSIKIAKKHLLKKEFTTVDVFNSWEARKLATHITEGLARLDPDHVINFSIVHKRPIFIMKKDHITMGNIWVDGEGLHFQFEKLFAKLEGDYEASANMQKALRSAKTRRLLLEAGSGQKLSYNSTMEIILEPSFAFSPMGMQEGLAQGGEASTPPTAMEGIKDELAPVPQSSAQDDGSMADRLKNLDTLKQQGLINKKEYDSLRQKILSEI